MLYQQKNVLHQNVFMLLTQKLKETSVSTPQTFQANGSSNQSNDQIHLAKPSSEDQKFDFVIF